MKEKIINFWLKIKSYFRFIFSVKPNLQKPKDVLKYRLVFTDFFLGDSLNTEKWSIGQKWGEFHPDFPYEYYGQDEEFIKVEDGCLNLIGKYKPKKFYDFKNNIQVNIAHGKGLIVSKQKFKYGYYEINGILPVGKYLWPSIWLTAVDTWPPEIDILEGDSGKNSDYSNWLGFKNVKLQPNIHFGFTENDTKENYGAFSYPIPFNPTKRSVNYGVHWTENFIKFYYDGHLIFQTMNKRILDYFNKPDVFMNIILNNGFQPKIVEVKNDYSVFRINHVKFFLKN